MFKKFKMAVTVCCLLVINIQASLQVAIAAKDFCVGNSLVLIARDGNGLEKVAGCVSLKKGKTQYSHDDISCHNETLSSITDQNSAIITDVEQDQTVQDNDSLIYLYFEVDKNVNVVRVLMIKNNFLADNPFNVVEFSTSPAFDDEENEDFDDFDFDVQDNDELSRLNLTDIQGTQATELSSYDKMVLGLYALWAVQTSKTKQMYKNITEWFTSQHAK